MDSEDPTLVDFAAVVRSWHPEAKLVAAMPLTGGVSAAVHRLTVDTSEGRRDVVYRSHASIDWKGLDDGVTAREFALMEALYAGGLPVPEALHLGGGGPGPPFMLLAFVEGTTSPTEPPLDERLRLQATLLARVHAASVPDLPALPQRLAPGDDGPPARSDLPLLHGDYWAGNVQWRDGDIVALFDWEDAAQGDPLSDLAGARLELTWSEGPDATERFTKHYLAAVPEAGSRQSIDRRLAPWEVYVCEAALASMHHWGLPAEQEARWRRRGREFLTRARRRA